MPPTRSQPSVIFFDAVGTLFHLSKGVGYHYALVGHRMGINLEADVLDRAFASVWKTMPARPATGAPRTDDDKPWWHALVDCVLEQAAPAMRDLDRAAFFEVVYEHFAAAGVWEVYPEVIDVLEALHPRYPLAIISNFDGRLHAILEGLGLSHYFSSVVISSEVGADKPDAAIYRRALELTQTSAHAALHVGNDPACDWEGAVAAGLKVFRLQRPRNSLRELLTACVAS